MAHRSALCCAVLLALAMPAWGAARTSTKAVAKPAAKAPAKAAKPAAGRAKAARKPEARPARAARGPTEVLTCRAGTEDRHARIAVVLVGGKTDSFAYYSKWKPRTCSIYLQRNRDPYSRWSDRGAVTNVSVERGLFMIEHGKGEYRFVFRDVDRERYCGMDGTINGTLTIRKGAERCELTGIMEEGVALGQANAHLEQRAQAEAPAAPAAAPAVTAAAPAPKSLSQSRRAPQQTWPAAASGVSD